MGFLKAMFISTAATMAAYGVLYAVRQGSLLKNTAVDVLSIKKVSLGIKQSNIDITLRIKNNSDLGFKITSQNYTLFIGDKPVGTAYSSDNLEIPPHASGDTLIHVVIYGPDVLSATGQAVYAALGNVSNVEITIKGKLSGSTGKLLISNVPINLRFKLSQLL